MIVREVTVSGIIVRGRNDSEENDEWNERVEL